MGTGTGTGEEKDRERWREGNLERKGRNTWWKVLKMLVEV